MPQHDPAQLSLFDYDLNVVNFPFVREEPRFNLNHYLSSLPEHTFAFRAKNNNISIANKGDYIIIDKSERTDAGDYVAVKIDDTYCVKLLLMDNDGDFWLISDRKEITPFHLGLFEDVQIIGKVKQVLKAVNSVN